MIIVPEETPLTGPYWAAAKAGRLVVQQCRACRRSWHPPQPSCPDCMSTDYLWRDTEPRGIVVSFTVVRHAVHPAVNDSVPYVVALVEVEAGVTVICNILDVAPDEIRIGAQVEFRLGRTPTGIDLLEAYPVG